MKVRPMDLPLASAHQYLRLETEYDDEIVHAYTGARWLDSQRYFVIKANPAKFDARLIASERSIPNFSLAAVPA